MATMNVLDSVGATVAVEKPLAPGQALMVDSRPVVIASNQSAIPVTGTFYQATQPVSGTITANAGTGTMAVSLASLPALATGGNVIGAVTQSGTWNIGTVTTVTTVSTVTNLSQFGGAAINLGAGAVGTGTLRTTQASDSPLVAATGAIGDAAWASGNGTIVSILKTVANAAQSTAPSAVSLDTAAITNNGTALTPKFAAIAAASSGNNTLVAAVTSKKIRVLGLSLIANGTVNGKFQSGASGTDLTGLNYLIANSGLVLPFNPVGWFESASGVLLNLNLSAAIAVGGQLVYVEV